MRLEPHPFPSLLSGFGPTLIAIWVLCLLPSDVIAEDGVVFGDLAAIGSDVGAYHQTEPEIVGVYRRHIEPQPPVASDADNMLSSWRGSPSESRSGDVGEPAQNIGGPKSNRSIDGGKSREHGLHDGVAVCHRDCFGEAKTSVYQDAMNSSLGGHDVFQLDCVFQLDRSSGLQWARSGGF